MEIHARSTGQGLAHVDRAARPGHHVRRLAERGKLRRAELPAVLAVVEDDVLELARVAIARLPVGAREPLGRHHEADRVRSALACPSPMMRS